MRAVKPSIVAVCWKASEIYEPLISNDEPMNWIFYFVSSMWLLCLLDDMYASTISTDGYKTEAFGSTSQALPATRWNVVENVKNHTFRAICTFLSFGVVCGSFFAWGFSYDSCFYYLIRWPALLIAFICKQFPSSNRFACEHFYTFVSKRAQVSSLSVYALLKGNSQVNHPSLLFFYCFKWRKYCGFTIFFSLRKHGQRSLLCLFPDLSKCDDDNYYATHRSNHLKWAWEMNK